MKSTLQLFVRCSVKSTESSDHAWWRPRDTAAGWTSRGIRTRYRGARTRHPVREWLSCSHYRLCEEGRIDCSKQAMSDSKPCSLEQTRLVHVNHCYVAHVSAATCTSISLCISFVMCCYLKDELSHISRCYVPVLTDSELWKHCTNRGYQRALDVHIQPETGKATKKPDFQHSGWIIYHLQDSYYTVGVQHCTW